MSTALVVQCFIKLDTLAGLCRSLLRCEGRRDVHLIFWRDVPPTGGDGDVTPNAARDAALAAEVSAYIDRFIADHGGEFASAVSRANATNLGTCATCEAAIGAAFQIHDFVIFTEDDTVFSSDALLWFAALRSLGVLDEPDVIALAGESIYFDSRGATLPAGYKEAAREAATERNLTGQFVRLNFLPSTCFATTRVQWARFGQLRGQPRGDEDVCALCRDQGLFVIFPVVPRVWDIGMLHADGYSVRMLGTDGVREVKCTYLTADDLPRRRGPPAPYGGSLGRLFEESVKLAGFDRPLPVPASRPAARPWRLWCFSLRNFGDALTPHLLAQHGVPFELVTDFAAADLLGIGSNLDRVRHDNPPLVVWSAGFMYAKDRPVSYGPDVRFLGVRGHRTESLIAPARRSDLVIGDGGLLAARLPVSVPAQPPHELGVMPHMSDIRAAQGLGLGQWSGVKMIDVLAPLDQVMADIASCRRLLSSSLHGLVTADALGIPSAYAVLRGGREVEGAGFKYADYASALGRRVLELEIGPDTTREAVIAAIDARGSIPPVPDTLLDELTMTLAVLRAGSRGLCTI